MVDGATPSAGSGLPHGQQLALGFFGFRFEARDIPMAAQVADAVCLELDGHMRWFAPAD